MVDSTEALRAALKARDLAPNRAEPLLALGEFYSLVGAADNRRALDLLEQADRLAPGNIAILAATAQAARGLGQFETALIPARRAAALDPRSAAAAYELGFDLLCMHRLDESQQTFARALDAEPDNPGLREGAAMVMLAQGDLAGARVVFAAVPKDAETNLVAYVASYYDLMWALDDAQQRLLLRLAPSEFASDRILRAFVLAQTYSLRGEAARGRAYADTAWRLIAREPGQSDNAQRRTFLGMILAYRGRYAEAAREGERGVAMAPPTRDASNAAYSQHQLARIYILAGKRDTALALLRSVLALPYFLTPAWLRIDPNFDPLRSDPRFQGLSATTPRDTARHQRHQP